MIHDLSNRAALHLGFLTAPLIIVENDRSICCVLTDPVSMLYMSVCDEDVMSATGGEVCVLCTTSSRADNPVPTEVVWKLNGSDITSYPPGTFVSTSGAAVEHKLVVVTPTPEFTGLYSCEVRESPAVIANRMVTVNPGVNTCWTSTVKFYSHVLTKPLQQVRIVNAPKLSSPCIYRLFVVCSSPGKPCG